MDRLIKLIFDYAVKVGNLTVVTASGRTLRFGDGAGPRVRVRFADPAAQRRFMVDPALRLGELYTDGRFMVEEGAIYDFLLILMRDLRTMKPPFLMRMFDRLQGVLWKTFPKNSASAARRNVAHHYDLGDDLYALFLDPDWQYSCAYFEHPGQSLAEAQLAKKRHIAAKLAIEPASRILDIGSGWGGLGLYLAKTAAAAEVVGVTLSKEQIERAKRRADEAGLAERVQFRLEDYRSLEGVFDRIVSVGMFEHVGLGFYDQFFGVVQRLLGPHGIGLIHTIGSTGTPGPTNPWILKYIFPGGHIPSLSNIMPAIERSGLVITDIEMIGPHYAETLLAWRTNFMARWEDAKALYDERFCRMWEFYLSLREVGFRTDDITVFQIQLAHERRFVPLTRDYLPVAEAALRTRETAAQHAVGSRVSSAASSPVAAKR